MKKNIVKINKKNIYPLLFLIATALFLEAIIYLFQVPSYLIPRPSSVITDIYLNIETIFPHLLSTTSTAMMGFIIGLISSFILSLLLSQFPIIRISFLPVLEGLQAIPVVAIAPFFLIWFGAGSMPKILLAALVVYFPATIILTRSLMVRSTEPERLFNVANATRSQKFFYLYLPGSIPALSSAAHVTATLSIIGAIVAELSGTADGLGFLIVQASYTFNSARLFSSLLLASLVAYIFSLIVRRIGAHVELRYGFGNTVDG